MFGQYGFFKEGLELFLGQRYGVGQQLFKKSHALAKPVCPVLALLLFLLLDQPLFLVFKLADFFLKSQILPLTTSLEVIESEVTMKRKLLEELYINQDVTTGGDIFYEDELLSIPFSGVVVDFFKGILSWEFEVQDGFKSGIEKTYYETGELEVENETDHNTVHGLSIEYYKSGKVKSKSIVTRNLFVDTVTYNEDGTVFSTKNDRR